MTASQSTPAMLTVAVNLCALLTRIYAAVTDAAAAAAAGAAAAPSKTYTQAFEARATVVDCPVDHINAA